MKAIPQSLHTLLQMLRKSSIQCQSNCQYCALYTINTCTNLYISHTKTDVLSGKKPDRFLSFRCCASIGSTAPKPNYSQVPKHYMVDIDRTRGNGFKLKEDRFRLDDGKKCHWKGGEALALLLREAVVPHPWRYWRPGWMGPWAAWAGGGQPCPWHGVGTGWPCNPIIIWVYEAQHTAETIPK